MTIKIIFAIAVLLLFALLMVFFYRRKESRQYDEIRRLLQTPPGNETFNEQMVAGLPDVVRRYFLHAIEPGTPLANSVSLKMSGAFRLKPDGDWLPMTGDETLNLPKGFIWRAKIGTGLMSFSGADYYLAGGGRMKFGLWGIIPVASATGRDTARSAIGRFVAEAFWLPSALLPQRGVKWEAIDDESARAIVNVDDEVINITFRIAPDGRLRQIRLSRWGDKTIDGNYGYAPFGGEITDERRFAGYIIPAEVGAGWWFGTDQYFEFFRAKIEEAAFDPSR